MIKIGDIQLNNPFVAAPLAGITDVAARILYKEMGAALVYSEMISGKGLLYKNKQTEQLLTIAESEKPVAYQIFGREPEVLAHTVRELETRENVLIDINMGCPVPKVVKNGEGAALLKEIDLIYDIIYATSRATKKPVTGKIRIGWSEDNIVAVEVAKAIESGGGAAVTVHGRTREQYYSGKADWQTIATVKKSIGIPVIGNGDIFNAEDAVAMLKETGCDMVMIARGMLGNPWIFRETIALWQGEEPPAKPGREEKIQMILRHLALLTAYKGEHVAVREMRKHIGWYLKGEANVTTLRRNINSATTVDQIKNIIGHIG